MTFGQLAPELIALAATFEDRAARIEVLADQLAARAAGAQWLGPAADRFRLVAAERRQQMRDAADALRNGAAEARLLASGAL